MVDSKQFNKKIGYYTEAKRKARFIVPSWIKDSGLAHLERSILCKETFFKL